MLEDHHGVGIVIGRFHQPFHIGGIAWIGNFDSLDGQQRTLHRTTMIWTSTAISARWNANHTCHGKFTHTQIRTLAQFGHQLVYARPDIIGKLNFYDRFCTHRAHSRRTSNDICLLNGRIEYPVFSVFIGQSCRFPKHTTQTMSYILPVQQRLRMLS